MRKPLFFVISGVSFQHPKSFKNKYFSKPFLGPPFIYLFFDLFQKNVDCGTPFKIRWDQKRLQNRPCGANSTQCSVSRYRLFSNPVFSRNHSNDRAFGTSCFLKDIFSMEIGYCSVYVVFLCALFYITFVFLSFPFLKKIK